MIIKNHFNVTLMSRLPVLLEQNVGSEAIKDRKGLKKQRPLMFKKIKLLRYSRLK